MLYLAISLERFPNTYSTITTPCLPKKGAGSKPLDHRLLSIFSTVYRVEAGAWFSILYPCCVTCLHNGGIPGHESCEGSWDAQADLEFAIIAKLKMCLLMVDYFKFFDSFGHQWVRGFLHMLHFPKALVEMIFNMYPNLL